MTGGGGGPTRRPGWLPAWFPGGRRDSPGRLLARSSFEAHPGFRLLRLRGAPEAFGIQHGVFLRGLRPAPGRDERSPRWSRGRRAPGRLPPDLDRERRALLGAAPELADPWAPDLEGVSPRGGWRSRAGLGLVVAGTEGGGDLLHLVLYDAPAASAREPLLFFRRPETGLAHLGLGAPGGLGLAAGVNEAGLSVSWLPAGRVDAGIPAAGRPVAPLSLVLRLVLERARTLTGAAHLLARALPRPGADRILLASAEAGQAVLLALSGARHEVEPMQGGVLLAGAGAGDRDAIPRRGPGGAPNGPEAALARLLARLPPRPDPEGLLALLRDPWPREGRGLLLTTPEPERYPGTPRPVVALLLDAGAGRLLAAADAGGGVHGPWLGFDLERGAIRRPAADLPASGLPAVGRAVDALLRGDGRGAGEALREARARERDHAVVLLLCGLAGDPEALSRLLAILPDSPHARLARAWRGEADPATSVRVPVPSICDPRAWLHPAGRRIRPRPG